MTIIAQEYSGNGTITMTLNESKKKGITLPFLARILIIYKHVVLLCCVIMSWAGIVVFAQGVRQALSESFVQLDNEWIERIKQRGGMLLLHYAEVCLMYAYES